MFHCFLKLRTFNEIILLLMWLWLFLLYIFQFFFVIFFFFLSFISLIQRNVEEHGKQPGKRKKKKQQKSRFCYYCVLVLPHCNIIWSCFLASVDPVWLGNCVVLKKSIRFLNSFFPCFLYILNVPPPGSDRDAACPRTRCKCRVIFLQWLYICILNSTSHKKKENIVTTKFKMSAIL